MNLIGVDTFIARDSYDYMLGSRSVGLIKQQGVFQLQAQFLCQDPILLFRRFFKFIVLRGRQVYSPVSFCVFVSLSYQSLSVTLSVSVSVSLSLSVSVCICFSVYVSTFSVYVSLSLYESLSLSVYLSRSPALSNSTFLLLSFSWSYFHYLCQMNSFFTPSCLLQLYSISLRLSTSLIPPLSLSLRFSFWLLIYFIYISLSLSLSLHL